MIHSIDHINLVVSDLDRSVKFYTRILGFKETKRAYLEGEWIEKIVGLKNVKADVAYILAPAGQPRIELLCYRAPEGNKIPANSLANTIGLRHIAFQVKNIEQVAKKIKDAGLKLIGEPISVPTNVISHDAGHKILCYFFDPDGILLELAEYR